MSSTAVKHVKLYEALASNRSTYSTQWDEIAANIYPRKGGFVEHETGGRYLMDRVYDGAPTRAASLFASVLHAMLASPATPWLVLETEDDKKMKTHSAKKYMQTRTRMFLRAIGMSNFHSQIHENFLDFGLFGNAPIYIEADPVNLLNFRAMPLSEMYLGTNFRGIVDTEVRRCRMDGRQMAQQFLPIGGKLPDKVRKTLSDPQKAAEKHTVLHIVRPNEEFTFGSFNKQKRPFESVWVFLDTKEVLYRSGYFENPYACPRFEVASGEDYGRGPGFHALPEVRALHKVKKHYLRAVLKSTDPATMAPNNMFTKKISYAPGSINYYNSRGSVTGDIVKPMPSGGNFPATAEEIRDLQLAVKESFFIDQFKIREADRMTAAEVRQRTQENQSVLSPILGRANSELLEPLVHRCDAILERAGYYPPPPPELRGQNLRVKFISPIAKSQRMSEVQALLGAMDVLTPYAQSDPRILETIKKMDLVQFVFDVFGAPLEVLEDPEEMKQRIAEQEQATQEAQQMQLGVESAKGIAAATKDMAQAANERGF